MEAEQNWQSVQNQIAQAHEVAMQAAQFGYQEWETTFGASAALASSRTRRGSRTGSRLRPRVELADRGWQAQM